MFLGGCVIGGFLVMVGMTLTMFIERGYFDDFFTSLKKRLH